MKRLRERIVGLLIVGGVLAPILILGALAVAGTGLIPVKASSRHWAITEWFLHFSMRRSVATHSLGTKVPELNDDSLVMRGAGHYDIGCRSCHGSPGTAQPRIAYQMTPPPPELGGRAREWSPAQLFSIVKHGVKFTGMPAWPAQERDDEVWAVVAFLTKLPDMDEADYVRLVGGEAKPTAPIETMELSHQSLRAINQTCVRCHGEDGSGRELRAFPSIAGQRQAYLENAMHAYAKGARPSGIMEPISAALKPEVIRELSAYYARMKPVARTAATEEDPLAIDRGRLIAHAGLRHQRVPACVECHTPEGSRTRAEYPIIAGQPQSYLLTQLKLFKAGVRGGSAYGHVMAEIAPRLKEEQMEDVARYFASLPLPAPGEPSRGRGSAVE